MAQTTCVKCNGHRFEIKQFEPVGGRYKQNFVQCTGCGTPAGVLDFFNVGAQTEDLKNGLAALNSRFDDLESQLRKVLQALRK